MADAVLAGFERDGFIGPVPMLSRRECRALMGWLDSDVRPLAADWSKGAAVTDWLLYRLAANPRLLRLVEAILGRDVLLWGCSVARRGPGEIHPWHVDIETSAPDGRFVTAWIGLENVRRNPGLRLIAGSHRAGRTVQEAQAEHGCRRGEAASETVLDWAREANVNAALVEPELTDGDAMLFDGRLWHGSRNDRGSGTRCALLLQFAAVDTPVRMHDEARLEWPFAFVPTPRPPTIVVAGTASPGTNRIVPPPVPSVRKGMPMISALIRSIPLPLEEDPGGWRPHGLFRGTTRVVDDMECHASVLSAGHCPHPPHAHHEEELLIVLEGEAELLIADGPSEKGARAEKVGPGAFAYYPAFQHHTIRNSGADPVSYLMFKWHVQDARPASRPLGATVFRYGSAQGDALDGWAVDTLFEQPTGWLGGLHCHTSRLEPGGGYAAHVDAYDVAILTLSGTVETLGQQVGPHSVIFYAAGEKHGIRNIGDTPAHYLVFEFHPAEMDLAQRLRRRVKPLAKQVIKRTARAIGVDLHRFRAAAG